MALTGLTLDPLRSYGKERVVLSCKVTLGASGAITSTTGKGWGTGPNQGSVADGGVGIVDVTLPGSGALQDILLLGAFVEGVTTADARNVYVSDVDLDNRVVSLTLLDLETPAATDCADGTVLHLSFLVKNSPLD